MRRTILDWGLQRQTHCMHGPVITTYAAGRMADQQLSVAGNLAGAIAHDFNNLLTPILGYTTILLESEHEPQTQDRLRAIHGASLRARELVQQMLTFSQQQVSALEKRPLDAVTLIKAVLAQLAPGMPDTLEFELLPGTEKAPVFAAPEQLQQVIVNLVNNAAQAMQNVAGTITLMVNTIEVSEQHPRRNLAFGNHLCIQVRDSGHGIPDEIQKHIFEPFFSTREIGQNSENSGLGLSLVRAIVSAHGGSIDVQSSPRGSNFSVYLPARDSASPRS